MSKSITLFLPELLTALSHEPEASPQAFPALALLLSRGRCKKGATSTEAAIKTLFSGLAARVIPAGALGALDAGLIEKGDSALICRADPIECHLDHRSAYMIGNAHLQLSPVEKEELVNVIDTHIGSEGFGLQAVNETQWYCFAPQYADVLMNDLLEVLGKNMGFVLPSGPDEKAWHKLITECQMLLMASKTNANRQQLGQPQVSSIWFWGLGTLPTAISTSFDQVYSNDPVIRGLAKCANVAVNELPTEYKNLPEKTLIVDNEFAILAKHQLFAQALERLRYYETHWFAPLLQALRAGEIQKLIINIADGREWEISKLRTRFFWKRAVITN
jgi:hypothetical protein